MKTHKNLKVGTGFSALPQSLICPAVTMSHQQDSEIYDIGIEFQPQLRRILLPSISNVTTVDGLLDKFSETAGTVKTSIKQAIPYRPCFYTGKFSRYGVTVAFGADVSLQETLFRSLLHLLTCH